MIAVLFVMHGGSAQQQVEIAEGNLVIIVLPSKLQYDMNF
jgi:hypothetical protein